MQRTGDGPNSLSSAYSTELNVQNVSYFMIMVISSRSEKRYSLVCLENWDISSDDQLKDRLTIFLSLVFANLFVLCYNVIAGTQVLRALDLL